MKRIICLLLVMFLYNIYILPSFVFSEDNNTTTSISAEELSTNTNTLVQNIRELIDQNKNKEAFSAIYKNMSEKKVIATWFLYVMLAQTGKISGNFGTVLRFIPHTGKLKTFHKVLEFWSQEDVLTAARLLATISSTDPALEYLTGKFYLSAGKQYQAAGYLLLGANMLEAPYGIYYAGLGQNIIGNFSKAYSLLSSAHSTLLPQESDLKFNTELQMAIAEFGDENYSRAYDLIMPLYTQKPIEVLKMMDPGLILTGMEKNIEAKEFWETALKQKLPASVSSQIKQNLIYNKRLVDPNYPPAWMNR